MNKYTYKLIEHPIFNMSSQNEGCFTFGKSLYSASFNENIKVEKFDSNSFVKSNILQLSPLKNEYENQKSPSAKNLNSPDSPSRASLHKQSKRRKIIGSVDMVSFLETYTENNSTDMSQIMLNRAGAGYCLDLGKNAELSRKFYYDGLFQVWNYAVLSHFHPKINEDFIPINPLIGIIEMVKLLPKYKTQIEKFNNLTIYKNEIRSKIIECCGWSNLMEKTEQLSSFCQKIGGYRAAAISAFHKDFEESSIALSNITGSDIPQLMILKGLIHEFVQEMNKSDKNYEIVKSNSIYKDLAESSSEPYLKLLFAFLSAYFL